MDRTLGEWGRKCIGHWVNGIEREERTVMSRSRRKVECPEMGKNKKK